ncbi:hypothetical protein IW262DRAFT_1466226 [Armillaria fumosa]|nr:hypothetical protein IW262DRAFT_1466226 [Armillaria fumosa]
MSLSLVFATGSDNNNGDKNLPPSHPGSPHDWSNSMNPGWGSNWEGNWGPPEFQPMWPAQFYRQQLNMGPPNVFYPPNWGGYAYSMQHYMPAHDDQMAVDNNTTCQPDHMQNSQSSSPPDELWLANRVIAHNDTQTSTWDPSDKKGKKKASKKELVQQAEEDEEYCMKAKQHDIEDEPILSEVLEIADRIHGQDCVGKLEE